MGKPKTLYDWSVSKQPIYLQVATVCRSRIQNGLWPRGEQVPTIERLMQEFGVGRVTIRHAFSELESEGLLVSARGRGTFVRAVPDSDLQRFTVGGTWAELSARGNLNEPGPLQLIGKGPAPLPADCPATGMLAREYQGVLRTYKRGRHRVCVSRVYVEAELYRQIASEIADQSVVSVLGNTPSVQLVSGDQEITFVSADEETAYSLGIAVGAPIAQIIRQLYDGRGLLIYWARVYYDARFLKLELNLFP